MTAKQTKYRPEIKTASILILVIIVFMICNNIVWQHIHILPDGTLVTHAHPYSKNTEDSPAKQHHHTTAEILLLESLAIFIPIAFLTLAFIAFFQKEIFRLKHIEFGVTNLPLHINGRAPPFIQ